jgi:hypothetical protein
MELCLCNDCNLRRKSGEHPPNYYTKDKCLNNKQKSKTKHNKHNKHKRRNKSTMAIALLNDLSDPCQNIDLIVALLDA